MNLKSKLKTRFIQRRMYKNFVVSSVRTSNSQGLTTEPLKIKAHGENLINRIILDDE